MTDITTEEGPRGDPEAVVVAINQVNRTINKTVTIQINKIIKMHENYSGIQNSGF